MCMSVCGYCLFENHHWDLSDIKDQQLFALYVTDEYGKYRWQTDSVEPEKRNWNIFRFGECGAAPIAISVTSDHVTVSHSISSMNMDACIYFCVRAREQTRNLFSISLPYSLPTWLCLCERKYKVKNGWRKKKWKNSLRCVEKSTEKPQKKWMHIAHSISVWDSLDDVQCACSQRFAWLLLWWYCYFTYCTVICCLKIVQTLSLGLLPFYEIGDFISNTWRRNVRQVSHCRF